MEPANLHQHHLQGRQVVGSSSLSTPSSHGAGSARAWTQNSILNTGDFNLDYNNGVILNSRQRNETLIPHPNNSMVQDMGFHWNGNAGATFTDHSAHDLQLPKIIKGKLSETFPTFSEMLISSPPTVKNKQMDLNDDLREKLLVKTVSSALPINGNPSSEEIYSSSLASTVPGRLNFCQIYPSINISNLNQPPSSISWGSFDMNLEALDLLNSTRFNGRFGQSASDNFAMCKENFSFDLDDGQQPSLRSPYSPSKVSSFNSEITGTKRPNSFMEPKATTQAAPKKSRLESRATCPPFKVRKEKLGDRIAALQQLVAPFGKTDTASVLMEAIGYIKFLQNQVETLSVPYMKSSHNKSSRTMPTVSTRGDENEEPKRDLLSRGLCLVPLSCMSYMTSDGGCDGGIWPPPC